MRRRQIHGTQLGTACVEPRGQRVVGWFGEYATDPVSETDTDRPAVNEIVGSMIAAGSSSSWMGSPVIFSARASNGTADSTPWRA